MKMVIVINQELPLGLVANTAAVLGLSMGDRVTGLTGPDIPDATGRIHAGITNVNIPVLGGSGEQLKEIYQGMIDREFTDVTLIDFNTVAQRAKCYEDYTRALAASKEETLDYLGICLYGSEKSINRLTGNLRLLR